MIDGKGPLDLVVQITTPENIRFEYRLAGPFRRFQAMAIDFIVRFLTLILLAIGVSFLAGFLGITGLGSLVGAFVSAFILIVWFLFTWFYGLFFESWMNGQTPGKRVLGLRVISVDGRPINAVQATIRNFLRVADTAPMISLEVFNPEMPPAYMIPTFLVALISMTMTQRMQRLGDLAAGTMVVIDEKNWYPKYARFEDPRVVSLSEFIPAGFRMSRTLSQAVALYVDRRVLLSPARRAELASYLASPLHKKFGFRPDTSPDLTLCALYYRNFVAAEIKEGFESLVIDAEPISIRSSPMAPSPLSSIEASSIEASPLVASSIEMSSVMEQIPTSTEKANEDRRIS